VKSGDVFDSSSCSSSHRVAQFQGNGETFWLSSTKLAVDAGSGSLRVISFN
jgi:hypothetical protein